MTDKTEQDYKTEMLACLPSVLPPDGQAALSLVHPDIIAKNYCCGLRFPELLDGLRVLSLGCGFVRDCFVLSKLIGQRGAVVGVDSSDHVISFAEKFVDLQRKACSYDQSNVKLVKCEPDGLIGAGLAEGHFDLICFNTVLGLTPKKRETMDQLVRVLKAGGEVFFTEMVADTRVREEVKKDQSLWVEGLAGAFYYDDLVAMAREFGFTTPRLVQSTPMRIKEPDLDEFIGHVRYSMATYRMFKLPPEAIVDRQETVRYTDPHRANLGPVNTINFDARLSFKNGKLVRVDPEMAAILCHSRYSSVFTAVTSANDDQNITHCPTNPFDADKTK